MNVRKFRTELDRHIKMQPYVRNERTPRRGSNGLLPSPNILPLYAAPSTPDMTGR